jgi:hypothetical protein
MSTPNTFQGKFRGGNPPGKIKSNNELYVTLGVMAVSSPFLHHAPQRARHGTKPIRTEGKSATTQKYKNSSSCPPLILFQGEFGREPHWIN